ncbi:MAG: ABC transporter ATP-binding protein [Lachnospiraceae bacterium]|nr:ABC transporter ATP-binding protein [Lachnospiraceae bacterium]
MKRWFKYIKPYLPFFILGPLCMIIEVVGEMMMPKLLATIMDYGLGEKDASQASGFVKWIYEVLGEGRSPFVIAIMVGMIMTAIIMMLGGVGGAYFGAKASVNFAADLREDLFRHVQKFSFANIDKFSTGSLVTRLTNDVTQMMNFMNMLLRMCLRSPGMLIGGIIMAISLNPTLTLTIAVVFPLLLIAIAIIISIGFPRFAKMQEKIDALNATVQESVTNVRVVKSFVREDYEIDKFANSNANLKKAGRNAIGVMIFMSPVMTFFMNATTIAVMWFGGNMLIDSTMTTGDMTAFVTYITQILSSLMMVTMMFVGMSRAIASGKRIAEVLDEKLDITDEGISEEDAQRVVNKGDIEFKNVSYRYYKNSEEKVIDNVNLKIEAGKTVGIIGSTGSGKTTLVSLISRLYDVDEGEVLVDGVNVKNYSLFNLREGVGVVLQKNVLFSGTIEENLRWGNENATMEEIRAAAESAQADGFVMAFNDGYDTVLDQGGTNVSGGQKQRLCIARALLKQPKIIIFDDSTSAVDTATEAKIRTAFRTSLKDSTKIIIAQRISSVIDADQIIVINDGKITGVGTHDELIGNNTEYQEIYYSQMDKKEAN